MSIPANGYADLSWGYHSSVAQIVEHNKDILDYHNAGHIRTMILSTSIKYNKSTMQSAEDTEYPWHITFFSTAGNFQITVSEN